MSPPNFPVDSIVGSEGFSLCFDCVLTKEINDFQVFKTSDAFLLALKGLALSYMIDGEVNRVHEEEEEEEEEEAEDTSGKVETARRVSLLQFLFLKSKFITLLR